MATVTCPAGHESTTADYCDTCGAPIGAAPSASGAASPDEAPAAQPAAPAGPPEAGEAAQAAAPAAAATCPSCGERVSGRFCESCGYDVEAGTPAAPRPVRLSLSADRGHWERMVGDGEPAFPVVGPTLELELSGDRAVLGRVRSGTPVDVDLALTGSAADPAVSHNQCIFERDASTGAWTVRDADSANGTWINDATEPLAAGAVHRLSEGDRILVGAWTCLTVHLPAPEPSTSPSTSPSPSSPEPA
jgi:predicted component of type VI protein secretion system